MARYIFITGGVVSSLGKGLASAALGALLQARGYKVRLRKLDPYLNVDPGTMSPYQHGEVFVTDDGAETDLDLGHYERFTGNPAKMAAVTQTGEFVENARWTRDGIVFATAHMIGSKNGLAPFPARTAEDDVASRRRTEAAAAWVRETFAEAKRTNASAVPHELSTSPSPAAPAPTAADR